VDFAVGFSAIKKIGESVERNEPLMMVHARDESALATVLPLLAKAATIA
jgi:thymidine phosphorylase